MVITYNLEASMVSRYFHKLLTISKGNQKTYGLHDFFF